jgi:hypothetical protein
MRTILKCAFAAMLISSVAGLHGTPRPAVADANQVSAASETSPHLARMEEVVRSYSGNQFIRLIYEPLIVWRPSNS